MIPDSRKKAVEAVDGYSLFDVISFDISIACPSLLFRVSKNALLNLKHIHRLDHVSDKVHLPPLHLPEQLSSNSVVIQCRGP
jgi:hypothetical protein